MNEPAIEDEGPRRGRAPRADVVATQRRRRRTGTLNRMAQFKLDCIEPEDLDLENYVYRWVNDENSRIRQLTKADDYDFVPAGELGEGFDRDNTDSESADRLRMTVGTHKSGAPLYAYLLRKPRAFWEEDNEVVVRNREEMMAGRVYRGETDEPEEGALNGSAYVPAGNLIGSAAERRRGPIPKNFK